MDEGGNAIRPAQDPTKDGHRFDNWYDEDGNLFVFATTPIIDDTTIYAKWILLFTVSFNLDEGMGNATTAAQPVDEGGNAIRPATDPTKDGHRFDDWYDEDDNPFVFATTPIIANTTIYAKWILLRSTATVEVNGGSFIKGGVGENPGTEVAYIRHDFLMDETPVTQGEWKDVMEKWMTDTGSTITLPSPAFNGNVYAAGATGGNAGWYSNLQPANTALDSRLLPMETLNWYAAIRFANILSLADGLDPVYTVKGSADPADWPLEATRDNYLTDWESVEVDISKNGWRLPTEEEWEYAYKGGHLSLGYDGLPNAGKAPANYTYQLYPGSNDASDVAWVWGDDDIDTWRTQEVGGKAPNALGLRDMLGNIQEMVGTGDMNYGANWDMNITLANNNFPYPRGGFGKWNAGHLTGFRLARTTEWRE